MKQIFGGIFVAMLLCCGLLQAQRPTNFAYIKGRLTQKMPAEISVIAKYSKGQAQLSTYRVTAEDSVFSLAVPVVDSATYILRFTKMKQGHVRLEVDQRYDYPMSVQPGTSLDVLIEPTLAGDSSAPGVHFSKLKGMDQTALISVRLSSSKYSSAYSFGTVDNGRVKDLESSRPLQGDSVMQFLVPVDRSGFYYLMMTGWQKRIYLKPGDQLAFDLDWRTKRLSWIRTSNENEQLYKWDLLLDPVTSYGYYKKELFVQSKISVDSFMAVYKNVRKGAAEFLSQTSTDNASFNRLFKVVQQVDLQLSALNYLYFNCSKKRVSFLYTDREYTDVPSYFIKQITAGKITDDKALFELGEGALYVNRFGKFALALLEDRNKAALDKAARLTKMLEFLPSDRQRASFLRDALGEVEVNNLSEFNRIFKTQERYAHDPLVETRFDQVFSQFAGDTAFIGKSVGDLTLTDVNGKKVRLNSFKNKVVFIDTWATWCGPCKEQVPYLKEVEKDYKDNKDIVFVGISIDRKADEQKWKRMIKTLDLHGIQLIDYQGSAFARPYDITAIPRFLLLDKQGKWIEVRCPKPANKKELKVYIDRALQ